MNNKIINNIIEDIIDSLDMLTTDETILKIDKVILYNTIFLKFPINTNVLIRKFDKIKIDFFIKEFNLLKTKCENCLITDEYYYFNIINSFLDYFIPFIQSNKKIQIKIREQKFKWIICILDNLIRLSNIINIQGKIFEKIIEARGFILIEKNNNSSFILYNFKI